MTQLGGGASHGSGGVPPVPQLTDDHLERWRAGSVRPHAYPAWPRSC